MTKGRRKKPAEVVLSKRERQVMDVVYELGEATAGEVMERLPNPPSYSAVRTTMRILEEKGHLVHGKRGNKYLYKPTRNRRAAGMSAIRRVVRTFFDNSASQAVAALLDASEEELTDEEVQRLSKMIEEAKEQDR
ncbi:MAG: BlaI/MecI/CopY family transcriptional regulator [Phycisphaerae bacterium]